MVVQVYNPYTGSMANLGNPNSNKGEERRGTGKKGEERKRGETVMIQIEKNARGRARETDRQTDRVC